MAAESVSLQRLHVLTSNLLDPSNIAVGKPVIVFKVVDGRAEILARGLFERTDGIMMVLGYLPNEYERLAGGAVLLDSREDVDPSDPGPSPVPLEDCKVADGDKYAEWLAALDRRYGLS